MLQPPLPPLSRLALPAVLILLACASWLALATGTASIPWPRVLSSLAWSAGWHVGPQPDTTQTLTVTQLRLPRLVLGLLIGASLAQAGAAMQAIFRNPLADPGLVGVSSGSALAAIAVIVLAPRLAGQLPLPVHLLLPAATFAGGLLVTGLVLRLATVDGVTRVSTLLLAGLAVNAVAGAGIGLLSHLADSGALRALIFWMFGSLGKAGWSEILIGAPLLLTTLLMLPREAHALNVLLLGEAEARHLGIDVQRLKRRVLLLIVVAAGTSVALAGMIGFVGLIVPHLVRLCTGPDHRALMPLSALLGAALLALADTAARAMLSPQELPVGILTALLGGPFFIALLLRFRGSADMS